MDKTITNDFPTMGTSAAYAENISGAPSPNTKPEPRHNTQAGAVPGDKANRANVLERNGFQGAPQVMVVYPNAPEAQATSRNVRLMPSAKGNKGFYARRAEAAPMIAPPFPPGVWTPPAPQGSMTFNDGRGGNPSPGSTQTG